MTRLHVSSGTSWEKFAGYSRAVRVDNLVWVAGTTASDENTEPVAVGDPYEQTLYIFRKIERALREVGASLEHIVRTRIFIVNRDDWEQVARAHGEIFGQIRPVNTLVTVRALIGDEYLVEIEADAYIDQPKELK
jgi:enamine deaminase RidA (YjgF/YER057c/UK114 family)